MDHSLRSQPRGQRVLSVSEPLHHCQGEQEHDGAPVDGPSSPASTAAQSLASLHQHAQSMILSKACSRDSSFMFCLLQWLPQSLHTAIVHASIEAQDRTLEACFENHPQPLLFLDALAALPADPPPIASLEFDFAETHDTSGLAARVAMALRHHSALAALRLSMDATTAQAELLAPAIASLSSLHSLHIGCPDTRFPADAMPALQAALHSLPQLDSLLISLDVTTQQLTLKRQRDADMPGDPPQPRHCLATLLASAPGLTSLHICLGSPHQPSLEVPQFVAPDDLLTDGASVSLPHLHHLVLLVDACPIAARLLRSLDASPLTSLVVEQSAWRHVQDVAECKDIARSLCAFPQLRSMHVNSNPETWAAQAFRILLQTPPTALTALRRLSELQIEVDFGNLHMAAPQLAAAMPALRQLTIACNSGFTTGIRSSREGWGQVLEHLGCLQLHLELSVTDGGDDTGPGLSALVPLTGLSALRLRHYDMMRAAADVEALPRMTQLRCLHLVKFTLPAELGPRLVPALLPLRRLTELFVTDRQGVHVTCGAQLHGAWPEVADVVGDLFLDEWVHLAARSLRSTAVRKPDSVLCAEALDRGGSLYNTHGSGTAEPLALSALPHHIQQEVLSAAASQDLTCVNGLLAWPPQSLHKTIVHAAIQTPHRTLKAQFKNRRDPLPFLCALATLPASPPSIASLKICHNPAGSCTKTPSPRTATHLATALRHHSMLSTLTLDMSACPDTAELLLPAIASLSSLHSLHLGGPHKHFPAGAIPNLQSTFSSLPQLSCLHLSLDVTSQLPSLKRQRDPDTRYSSLQLRPGLATLLSSAPGLTSLTLRLRLISGELPPSDQNKLLPDGATICLQQLRHLVLRGDDWTVAIRLLHSLHASPITDLDLNQPASVGSTHTADSESIAGCLSAFTQLRSMHITSMCETWVSRALCRELSNTGALDALGGVSDVNITVDLRTLHQATAPLAFFMPSLQRLTVKCDCYSDGMESLWPEVLGHLSRLQLRALQCLDLSVTGDEDQPGPALPALLALTCLTALRLEGYSLVQNAEDLEALSQMTQLRALHLDGCDLPFCGHLDALLVPALLPLRRLTRLVVSGYRVHEALVAASESHQLRGAWPELRHLGMGLDQGWPKAALLPVVRAMCGLPVLQQIVVMLFTEDSGSDGPERLAIGSESGDGSAGCRAWLTACAASEEERMLTPFPTLCTILKVAVVVDDQKLDEWVQLAAECLTCAAAPERDTTPTDQPSASSALSSCTAALSLASLQDHSRSMILSAACAPDRSCMLNLLQWLPQSLHTAIVDAAIKSPHRSLKACFEEHHQPLPFLDALATLPADPPSIASLHINFTNWKATASSTDRASLIATALRHHSALSTLKLSMAATAAEVQRLAPAISSLSSLRSLNLGDFYTLFPADAIHDIQSVLRSLPQLDCLHLSLDVTSQLPALKRQRDADTPEAPPPSHHSLATMLSSAPGLTSLHVRLQPERNSLAALQSDAPDAIFPDGVSVSLPHLRHAALMVDDCTVAARLLRSLDASPLTSLVITQSEFTQPDNSAIRTEFAHSLCAFPQLRSMHLTCTAGTWAARSLEVLLHFSPTALTALQQLSELQLFGDFVTLHMAAPQLATVMPALRKLTIRCTCSLGTTPDSLPERWADVLGHLSPLQLSLDLTVEGQGEDSGPGPSSLVPLTCFSALQLRSYNMVRVAADVEALARMTQLRSLNLDDFILPAEFQARLMLALLPLRRLTELLVVGEGVHVAYEAKQLQGVWPELEHLGVSLDASRPSVELRAVFRAMCGLPALQQLELFAQCGCASGDVGRRGGDGEDIADVPGSLWDVAAAAGVKVEFFGDFTFMDS